jgi:hypothetical protein
VQKGRVLEADVFVAKHQVPARAAAWHAADLVPWPRPRVRHNSSGSIESWLEWRDQAERPVPGYVEEELRGYLECGILCFGFGRALCTGCGQGFVIAFSCKGRGVCPSCNGRHMAQTAAPAAARPRLGGISPATASARR